MARRYQLKHPRSPAARWARRVLGVAGTAVVLAVGVVAATMVMASGEEDDELVARAPTATPVVEKKQRKPRLTARQREERRGAADELRRRGYEPVELADYRPDHVLRVLIGAPTGSTPAGLRAFFFVRNDSVGQDARSPSLRLRPGRQREREITLVYTLYEEGDRECCPQGGDYRVHFRWTGEALEPREELPPDFQRLPAAFAQ
jgi:hypothetical protein